MAVCTVREVPGIRIKDISKIKEVGDSFSHLFFEINILHNINAHDIMIQNMIDRRESDGSRVYKVSKESIR